MRDDKDESESARRLKHFDKAQEIARACLDTRVVTVCDREEGIWELLSRAVATGAGLAPAARSGGRRCARTARKRIFGAIWRRSRC